MNNRPTLGSRKVRLAAGETAVNVLAIQAAIELADDTAMRAIPDALHGWHEASDKHDTACAEIRPGWGRHA